MFSGSMTGTVREGSSTEGRKIQDIGGTSEDELEPGQLNKIC